MKPSTPIAHQSYLDVQPYVTKDRSTIRELMCLVRHGNHAQSLAEAIIPAGGRTRCTGTCFPRRSTSSFGGRD